MRDEMRLMSAMLLRSGEVRNNELHLLLVVDQDDVIGLAVCSDACLGIPSVADIPLYSYVAPLKKCRSIGLHRHYGLARSRRETSQLHSLQANSGWP
jgi:hypothetical protein